MPSDDPARGLTPEEAAQARLWLLQSVGSSPAELLPSVYHRYEMAEDRLVLIFWGSGETLRANDLSEALDSFGDCYVLASHIAQNIETGDFDEDLSNLFTSVSAIRAYHSPLQFFEIEGYERVNPGLLKLKISVEVEVKTKHILRLILALCTLYSPTASGGPEPLALRDEAVMAQHSDHVRDQIGQMFRDLNVGNLPAADRAKLAGQLLDCTGQIACQSFGIGKPRPKMQVAPHDATTNFQISQGLKRPATQYRAPPRGGHR